MTIAVVEEEKEELIRRKVKIIDIRMVKDNVVNMKLEKPEGFSFIPGQSIEMTYDNPEWKGKKRPFSFVSLPSDEYLEFMIRIYDEHDGFTKLLKNKKIGDVIVLLGEPFGKYAWKGKGVFIAGGLGITPLYDSAKDHQNELAGCKFIYSAKDEDDVVLGGELDGFFGKNLIYRYSGKEGRIDKDFLRRVLNSNDLKEMFYVCGPAIFKKQMREMLEELGVSSDKIIG